MKGEINLKKRSISILLILTLTTLSFTACGSTQEVADADIKAEESISFSHDFDNDSNMQEEIYEISYQIPDSWERKEASSGFYYYPKNGMLFVSVDSSPFQITDSSAQDDYIKGFGSGIDDFQEKDRYLTNICGIDTLAFEFSGITAQEHVDGKQYVFVYNDLLYGFIYSDFVNKNSYPSHLKDFEEIIKSITIIAENESNNTIKNNYDTYSEPDKNKEESLSESVTLEQKNALAKGRDYLDFSAFSYTGLISQLEYEGFSTEAATYAANNCGADWNEQAAKKAQNYLDFSSFSRQGLIDQLVYEGFTQEQAEYGASSVGY